MENINKNDKEFYQNDLKNKCHARYQKSRRKAIIFKGTQDRDSLAKIGEKNKILNISDKCRKY